MKNRLISILYNAARFVKVTLRNIWRNRRRSLITISSIGIGTVALVLLNSYVTSIDLGMKNDAIQKQYGHFQIAQKGYFDADENSFEHMIDEAVMERLMQKLATLDYVDYSNTRVHLNGIIGTQKSSTFFTAIAGIPEAESMMAPTLVEGNLLSRADPAGVLIGESMAKKLNVKVGDDVVAFVSTPSGSQEAILMNIRGIYDALMQEQEKVVIYMTREAAWSLTLENNTHRVLVLLGGNEKLAEAIAEMERFIEAENLDLEIRDWNSLAIFFKQVVGMFQGMIAVVGIIVFLVIIFNIQNTMHMSIHERFREIGTMRAMGSSRGEIVLSFLAEGFFIGLLGAAAGILIAVVFMPWANSMEFTLPPGPGQDKPTPIFFTQTTAVLINAIVVNMITAFLASIFPALKGSKIKIIDALRYV